MNQESQKQALQAQIDQDEMKRVQEIELKQAEHDLYVEEANKRTEELKKKILTANEIRKF